MHMPPPVHGASMVGKYIHDSELINSEFDCYFLNPTTAKNLEDVSKFRIGKVFDVFGLIKRIKEKVREVQPDLVYFTANATGMPFYKDFLIVSALKNTLKEVASRRSDSKEGQIVVHYHNKGVATRQDHILDNMLYKRFFKGLKIILLTDNLYSDIKKYVKRTDVQICENGIPDLNPTITFSKSSTINLFYLGNMMAEKGVWTLLYACKELMKRGVDFHCDFVGGWKDVSEKSFNDVVADLGIGEYVSAHGAKYGDEKEPFFEKADVMVFPTYYHNECFPLVLLEGMMHGLACVSTREAGIPGIVSGFGLETKFDCNASSEKATGFLVERKNASQLADAIERLANNQKLWMQMCVEGRKKYVEQFSLPVFEKRLTECIKNLL